MSMTVNSSQPKCEWHPNQPNCGCWVPECEKCVTWGLWSCIDGVVYGPCSAAELCGGICEAWEQCGCDCHESVA